MEEASPASRFWTKLRLSIGSSLTTTITKAMKRISPCPCNIRACASSPRRPSQETPSGDDAVSMDVLPPLQVEFAQAQNVLYGNRCVSRRAVQQIVLRWPYGETV